MHKIDSNSLMRSRTWRLIATVCLSVFMATGTANAGLGVDEQLFDALRKNNPKAVEKALQNGAYINARVIIESTIDNVLHKHFPNTEGHGRRTLTPISVAVERNEPAQISKLLAMGASLQATVRLDYLPEQAEMSLLQYALFVRADKSVDFLLQQGLTIQPEDLYLLVLGDQPYAKYLTQFLQDWAADPELLNQRVPGLGMNAMHFALATGNHTALKQLVAAGMDVSIETAQGQSPMALAMSKANSQGVKILLENGVELEFGSYSWRNRFAYLRPYYRQAFVSGDIQAVEWMNAYLLENYRRNAVSDKAIEAFVEEAGATIAENSEGEDLNIPAVPETDTLEISELELDALNFEVGFDVLEDGSGSVNLYKTLEFLIALNNRQPDNDPDKTEHYGQLFAYAIGSNETTIVDQLLLAGLDPFEGNPLPIQIAIENSNFALVEKFLAIAPSGDKAATFAMQLIQHHVDDLDTGFVRHYEGLENLLAAVKDNTPSTSATVSTTSGWALPRDQSTWQLAPIKLRTQLPSIIWSCYLLSEVQAITTKGLHTGALDIANVSAGHAHDYELLTMTGTDLSQINPWDCAQADLSVDSVFREELDTFKTALALAILTLPDRDLAMRLLATAPIDLVNTKLKRGNVSYELRSAILQSYPQFDFYYDDISWLDFAAVHYQQDVAEYLQQQSPPMVTEQEWLNAAAKYNNLSLVSDLLNKNPSLTIPESIAAALYSREYAMHLKQRGSQLPTWVAELGDGPPEIINLDIGNDFLGCKGQACEVPLLIYAVDIGAYDVAKTWLEAAKQAAGDDIAKAEVPRHHYATAIFHARSLSMIRLLETYGYDVNAYDMPGEYEENPLSLAVVNNEVKKVRTFLAAGADPNMSFYANHPLKRLTPLGYAIGDDNDEIVELLLQHNADINGLLYAADEPVSCKQSTPIMQAMYRRPSVRLLERMVAAGADLNYRNDCEIGVLSVAKEQQDSDFIRWIIVAHAKQALSKTQQATTSGEASVGSSQSGGVE